MPARPEAGAGGTDVQIRSIAVVPFVNLTGDADQNYLADGIVEDFVTDLSNIPDLSVAPTSATAMFRNASMPAERVALELGVQYILEGTVRNSHHNVRVTAKLIEGRTNRQMWAQRYDRELIETFDLQSEIAASVASTLKLQLAPMADVRTAARGKAIAEAHENYLRGRALMREMTRHSLILAQQAFERSIALDPHYALAMSGLAECITTLRWHYDGSIKLLEQAAELCRKALAIEPRLAEAHCSLGLIHSLHQRFDKAEAEFQQAVAQVPDLHEAHLYRGLMYLIVGRAEEAYPPMLRAYELKSQDLHTGMMLLNCQTALGRIDDRRTTARDVLKLARRRISLNPYDERAIYVGASALQALGETEEATRWARVAASFEIEDARTTYNIACTFALLGETDEAIGILRKTLELGVSPSKIVWMRNHDSDFDRIRTDPRFAAAFEGYA